VVAVGKKSAHGRLRNDRHRPPAARRSRHGFRDGAGMDLTALLQEAGSTALATALTVVPVGLFLVLFHRVVLRQRLASAARIVIGFVFIIIGLTSLLLGL